MFNGLNHARTLIVASSRRYNKNTPQRAGLALTQPVRAPMDTKPPITTSNPQHTWSTKPDQEGTTDKNI